MAVLHAAFGARFGRRRLTVCCALLMPVSGFGFWLLIPPAGLLLRAGVERR